MLAVSTNLPQPLRAACSRTGDVDRDPAALLYEWRALRDAGVLSNEEFEAKKQVILRRF
jgi:hypothetical protein